MYLENINGPEDVKKLDAEARAVLAQEIRDNLLVMESKHGGHFGPNFGIVEATIALHTVFNSPVDHIVYDVSHQTYPHKMLTGRKQAYMDPALYDSVSPYTDPAETPHDLFKIGHTSTSISLALGLAKARDIMGGKENIIAVIGDGSMSGGEALEGLNVAGELNSNFIIVFNDNQMSIAENHGGMYDQFAELRRTNGAAENNLFKSMGLDYLYINDGNDIEARLIRSWSTSTRSRARVTFPRRQTRRCGTGTCRLTSRLVRALHPVRPNRMPASSQSMRSSAQRLTQSSWCLCRLFLACLALRRNVEKSWVSTTLT